MRLLLFANDYPSPWHPTKGTFNRELALALARQHDLHVICPIPWMDAWNRRPATLHSVERVSGRHSAAPRLEVHYPRYYYPPKLLRNQYGWFYWQSVRGTVRRVVASSMPEAVLAYWAHPDGEVAVRVASQLGIPSGVIVGGSDVLLITTNIGRRRRVVNVLERADAIFAVSRHLKSAVTGLGVGSQKVHVWRQGIDASLFGPGDGRAARFRLNIAPEEAMLLWVGRMVPVKGLDVLVAACAVLRHRGVTFRLYLVGDGPLRGQLEARVVAAGLSGVVTFVGPRQPEHLGDWYRAADVTVLPSLSEGLPNVLRESHACGTRFVASRVGGIAEIAREGLDRLTAPGDARDLADALCDVLSRAGASFTPPPPTDAVSWEESADSLVTVLAGLARTRRNSELRPGAAPRAERWVSAGLGDSLR